MPLVDISMTHSLKNLKAEAAFDQYVGLNLRRNYAVNLAYGLFGTTGFHLIMAPTFVPKYIMTLSGSNVIVGLLQFVAALSHIFSLLFAVRYAEAPLLRKRVVGIGLLMRAQILFIALAGFFLPNNLNLIVFFAFYSLFSMFLGYQNILYNTTMSKIIPVRVRGLFVGIRNFLGGLTAWFVTRAAAQLCADLAFPASYAWTFLAAFSLTTIGICFFALSNEPPAPFTYPPTPAPRKLLQEMWEMTINDRSFRNFLIARVASNASFIAGPFFILYAAESLDLSFSDIATITSYLFITQTISTLIWGRIADRTGFRFIFILGLILMMAATATILIMPPSLGIMYLVFSTLGAGASSFYMGSNNLVLEFGTIEDRPRRIAATAIAGELMRGLAPFIGGLLADLITYQSVFAVGLSCLIISILIMYRLVKEPRFSPQA
jgi:MFS family permease